MPYSCIHMAAVGVKELRRPISHYMKREHNYYYGYNDVAERERLFDRDREDDKKPT